ncbi:MAG: hypothetical protein FWC42_01990 [Proteobacteria bacterium]|nr:hypothetical protein [Pseudomonadota bacterium]
MKTSEKIRLDYPLSAIARKGGIDVFTKNAEVSPSYISQLENNVVEQKTGKTMGVRDDTAGKIKRMPRKPRGRIAADRCAASPSPAPICVQPVTYPSTGSGLRTLSNCPWLPSDGEKKQWNALAGKRLPLSADGLRQLKAKPKNRLTVKVIDCNMGTRLFSSDTKVINRPKTRNPVVGRVFAPVDGGEKPVECLFVVPDDLYAQSDNPLGKSIFEWIGSGANAVPMIGRVGYRCGTGDFYLTKESL